MKFTNSSLTVLKFFTWYGYIFQTITTIINLEGEIIYWGPTTTTTTVTTVTTTSTTVTSMMNTFLFNLVKRGDSDRMLDNKEEPWYARCFVTVGIFAREKKHFVLISRFPAF